MTADVSDITFDDEAGVAAAGLYQRFADEAGMSSMSESDARQAFPAGTLANYVRELIALASCSRKVRRTVSTLRARLLPVVASENVYFPTGGSAIVMMTDDPEKQNAAWETSRS